MVLLVRAKRVVNVPLQVDGQVGDPEEGAGHMDQAVDQLAVNLQVRHPEVQDGRKLKGGNAKQRQSLQIP